MILVSIRRERRVTKTRPVRAATYQIIAEYVAAFFDLCSAAAERARFHFCVHPVTSLERI
jgi:hypothetical protein